MRDSRRITISIAICLAVTMGVRAGEHWPVQRGNSREPQPYRYHDKAWKNVPRDFLENASACILYYATSYRLEADGTVETTVHEITRLNGRRGVEKLGEYRGIQYDPSYQKLTLNVARIFKTDGTSLNVEPRHLKLRDIGTDYQVYNHDKELVVSFPNLAVGDVYEVKWTTRGKDPENFGHFYRRYGFGYDLYPIAREELRVLLPAKTKLNFAYREDDIEHTFRVIGSNRFHQWSVIDNKPLANDTDAPPREMLRKEVLCSTFSDWKQVADWKKRLRADCWKCTPEIRKIVAEVTAGLKTPLEKARALTYWVRRHVRYISLSSSGHGYTPRLPAQVLDSRYGDCKDQAQLLAVMLRECGLDVWLVSLGIRGDGQIIPSVPCPWSTHAILLVEIDGEQHWIDTTAPDTAWNFLPRADRDRVVYVTRDDKIRLLKTPSLSPEEHRYQQISRLTVQPDGSSLVKRTMRFHGLAAVSRRQQWLETPPGERRRAMNAELQDAHNGSRLLKLDIDDNVLRQRDQPVAAKVSFAIDRHFDGKDNPEGSITDSNVWGRLLGYNLTADRKLPLDLWAPVESIHRYVIDLPTLYRFNYWPDDVTVKSKWGFFERTLYFDANEPRRLEVVFRLRLHDHRVDTKDFAAFRRFHARVLGAYRVWVTLERTSDIADASLLAALNRIDPRVERVTHLARLCMKHGDHDKARKSLALGRVLFPGDKQIWELSVQAARSVTKQAELYERMVGRFPKEPRYAVALGATRVELGDYSAAGKILLPLTGNESSSIRAQAHYQLARAAFAKKQLAVALQHLNVAKIDHPDTVATIDALRFKARIHEQLHQVDEAITVYNSALEKQPRNASLLRILVDLELQQKDSAKALHYLRRYTLLAKKDIDRLLIAADLHLRLGRLDDAYELAQRARQIRYHPGTQRILGIVHLRRDQPAKAAYHLERTDPDAEVIEGLIRSHVALGNLVQTRVAVGKIAKLTSAPKSLREAEILALQLMVRRATIWNSLKVPRKQAKEASRAVDILVCAELAHAKGRTNRAIELLDKTDNHFAPLGPAKALRGLLALESGRLRQASKLAAQAICLSPKGSQGFYVRGRVRHEREQPEALNDLEKAAELSKRQDGRILHWLAAAQFDAGKVKEAIATQEEARRLLPGAPDVVGQLTTFRKQAESR